MSIENGTVTYKDYNCLFRVIVFLAQAGTVRMTKRSSGEKQ